MNLIEDNMNLVYFLVSRYYPTFTQDEDIIQSGMVGLCRAADTWDESKSMFSTYASKCILNEILQEFKRRKRHYNTVSLDQDVTDDSTLSEFLIGDEDIDFVDFDGFYNQLNPREKEIVKLQHAGVSVKEIAEKFDCSQECVYKHIRLMKTKWREFNGD